MNIVFVTHGESKKMYTFEVPDFLVSRIQKGMYVLVETRKGPCVALAVTGVISGDGALDIAKTKGARFPLAPVVSVITPEVVNFIEEKFADAIVDLVGCRQEVRNVPLDEAMEEFWANRRN